MELLFLKPNDIKVVLETVRKNEYTIKAITNSINEFGFLNPILVNQANELICGEARLQAALILKMELIPCIIVDMSLEKASAYKLIDNQIQVVSVWNHMKKRKRIKQIGINIDKYGLYDEMKGVKEIDKFFIKQNESSLFDHL